MEIEIIQRPKKRKGETELAGAKAAFGPSREREAAPALERSAGGSKLHSILLAISLFTKVSLAVRAAARG